LGLPPERLSAFYFLLVFRGYFYNSTAYIKGNFSELFKAMIEEIKGNGSQVIFNTTVKKIITQKNCVKAVATDSHDEIRTKTVISNCNAIDTLTHLLEGERIRKEYLKILSPLEKSISAFQVYLGLSARQKV